MPEPLQTKRLDVERSTHFLIQMLWMSRSVYSGSCVWNIATAMSRTSVNMLSLNKIVQLLLSEEQEFAQKRNSAGADLLVLELGYAQCGAKEPSNIFRNVKVAQRCI